MKKPGHNPKQLAHPLVQIVMTLSLLPVISSRAASSGLSSRLVEHVTDGFIGLSLVQDQRGFIWCGTNRGLFRYDGYTLEFLRHDINDPSTLSDDQVNALALADDGHIWVGTSGGLDRLNPVSRTVQRFSLLRPSPGPDGHVYVTSVLIDSGGVLWVGTQKHGLLEARVAGPASRDSLIVRQYTNRSNDQSSLSNNHVHTLWSDSRTHEGFLFIGTSYGLNRLSKASGRCERYFHDPTDSTSLMHDEVWTIASGDSGEVWLGTGDGVCSIKRPGATALQFIRVPVQTHGPVFTIATDNEGQLWFGTHTSNIVRYNPRSMKPQQQSLEQTFYGRRYGNAVYTSMRDDRGAVWFGVHYGLERYDPMRKPFEFVPLSPPPDRWLVETTAFCEGEQGDLWFGTTARGVFRCRIQAGDTINYMHKEGDPRSLCSNEVNTLLKDHSARVWIGTTNGLDCYVPTTEAFEHFVFEPSNPADPLSLPGACVYDLLEDHSWNLWVATNGGLSKLDPSTMRLTHYLHKGEMIKLGFFIGAILQPQAWKDGSFLIASKGLFRFDPETTSLTPYHHGGNPQESPIDQMIFGLTQDRNGNVWASTFSGLYLLGVDGTVRHYTAPQMLSSNLVCQAIEDEAGAVWASTADAGIMKITPGNETFKSFALKEGFLKNSFCIRGAFRSSNGTIYLGAANGFHTFHPATIHDNPIAPVVRITGMHIFDRPVVPVTPFENIPELVLSHTDNMVIFDFVALCYNDPASILYAYRLEGLSEEWLHCGTSRTATFTNLEPGSYIFRVRACNGDGVWTTTGASLAFVIEPPFWQTWWFRALGVILFGTVIYSAYRYRMKRILAVERLRLRIANDLHDDIGSDLSGIALESDLLARRLSESDPVRERLRSVGHTIRSAADNLRDVVWIVSPDQDKIEDLVKRMREVADKMLPSIHYEFSVKGAGVQSSLDMEFKRHVLMMFKEMLHNVVSHAQASRVEIEFVLAAQHLRLCVKDDGIGFDTSRVHGGRGLRSLTARTSAIKGELIVESTPNCGTTVCLEADIIRL